MPAMVLADRLGLPRVETYHTFFEEYLFHYVPFVPRRWMRALARRFSRTQCNSLDAVVVPSLPMHAVLREYGVTVPLESSQPGWNCSVSQVARAGVPPPAWHRRRPADLGSRRPGSLRKEYRFPAAHAGASTRVCPKCITCNLRRRTIPHTCAAWPSGWESPTMYCSSAILIARKDCWTATVQVMRSCLPRAPKPKALCCWRPWHWAYRSCLPP